MRREIDTIRATRSAQKVDRKLIREAEVKYAEIIFDILGVAIAAGPSFLGGEYAEAVIWGGMAFILLQMYHAGKIAWQDFRVSGMDYEEVGRDINKRLKDQEVRRRINRYLK